MNGLKRYIRPGVVISAIGHVAFLALGLHLVGANPSEPITPDAMVVDIVPPDEAPRFEGTPSELRTSGSEVQLKSPTASAVAQSPPPKPAAQSQQQTQKPSKEHPSKEQASKEQVKPQQAPVPPQMAQDEIPRTDAVQAELTQIKASDPPPPAPPQPQTKETPDQPGVAETLAQLALVGGRLGGGFAAPPVDTNKAGYDFTLPFRERVSSCADPAPGVEPGDKVSIALRISLNRDGSLASRPELLAPITSAKEEALMHSAMDALQKCQPYTMLPTEKYKAWKTLDLVFFPLNFMGR
jgi:outer membrane biosynthesis protein TonB